MALIDLTSVNSYPHIRRVQVGTTAQQFTLPEQASKVTIGGDAALFFSTQDGEDGDSFGVGSDIENFCFVPVNNLISYELEKGKQATRNLCVGAQTGQGYVSIILEKR